MKRYGRLYLKYLQQYIKSLIEYRADFILGLIGFIFVQFTGVIFITLIFNNIPTLSGWSFYEILFIYGFAQIPRGIDHIFTDNLWIFCWKTVAQGDFDRYLLRPLNPLFQLLSERFQPDGFGEIIMGIILFTISSKELQIEYSFIKIVILVFAILCSTLIYTAIKLAVASIAFWIKFAQSYLFMVYQLSGFVKYPIKIYPKGISALLTYIIPFAFTGYYPAAYFLGKENFTQGIIMTFTISFIGIIIAYKIWLTGTKYYESAGS